MSNGETFPINLYVSKEPVGFSAHDQLDFFEMGDTKLVATYKLIMVEKVSKVITLQRDELKNVNDNG